MAAPKSDQAAARVEIREPQAFRAPALLAVHVYGLLLVLPVLLATLWMSVSTANPVALILPFAALAFSSLFLPVGLGNPCVSRIVRSRLQPTGTDPERFIVQLTLAPRLRTGLRAVLEDADDIGWLSFTESELRFDGDSVALVIPRETVKGVRPENIGLRTLFVYGPRLSLEISGLDDIDSIEFAERSSSLIFASRKTARQLRQAVTSRFLAPK